MLDRLRAYFLIEKVENLITPERPGYTTNQSDRNGTRPLHPSTAGKVGRQAEDAQRSGKGRPWGTRRDLLERDPGAQGDSEPAADAVRRRPHRA